MLFGWQRTLSARQFCCPWTREESTWRKFCTVMGLCHLALSEVISGSSGMREYVVVEIMESSKLFITVVPRNWVCESEGKLILLCPSQTSGNELALIKSCTEPDPGTWNEYNVLTMTKAFDKYPEADFV